MAAALLGLLSPYPKNLLPEAQQALSIKVKDDAPPPAAPDSQYNKWFSLKTIDHIPAYILFGGGVAGIVIIIAAAHLDNSFAIAGGALFTAASFAGCYYCYKFTTMKPLIDLVGQLTAKVKEIDQVRNEIQAAAQQYQELEKKLKADNDRLGKLVSQESQVVAEGKKNIDQETGEMEQLLAKLKAAEKKLAAYQSLCDTLKGQLSSLAQDLGAYNKTSGVIDKNISALDKDASTVDNAQGEMKADESKLEADNRQLAQLALQITTLIAGLRKDVAQLQDSHTKVTDELAKQKALLSQMGQEVVGVQSAADKEGQTGHELGDAANNLASQLAQLRAALQDPRIQQILLELKRNQSATK